MFDMDFYKEKKVLVTGHTGFKGTWMCKVLLQCGADVTGYALTSPTEPSLFNLLNMSEHMDSIQGDIRNYRQLSDVFNTVKPEIVIHMAAQPLVRDSYENPMYTYDVNVMGTVNVLECIRQTDSVRSFVNVTTDKVYKNREWEWGYREDEELNGYDPYSNSKSCSELVTSSYVNSFLKERGVAVSTARAGNVIGGGDFSANRIIPDCVRAAVSGEKILVRNPYSMRPYQHVLEPIFAYLLIAQKQYDNNDIAGCYNVGPDEKDCISTGELVRLFCDIWNADGQEPVSWKNCDVKGPHEANLLKLDCSRLKSRLEWSPVWSVKEAVAYTIEWTRAYIQKSDIGSVMNTQIEQYMQLMK